MLYAAMRNAVLACSDGGEPAVETGLPDRDLECVAASPEAPERAFCGTFEAGLFRTTDAGESWERVGSDVIREEAVMSAAVHPEDPAEVWVGTEPSGLYRSTDAGDTWERVEGILDLPSSDEWSFPPRPHTHHVRWIEPDSHDPGRLYVGIEAGALLVTPDRGSTWIERPEGSRRDNHQLAIHPDAPGRVYSAAGDGYAVSEDGGETWAHPQEGLAHRYVWSVAVDPGDPETVLVSSASGAGSAHRRPAESYVYRRSGSAWERLDDRGLPVGEGVLRAVLAPGRNAGEVYAINNHGLYRSADAGDTWERLGVPWPEAFEERTARGLVAV
ncbi:MAG: WD40/YVTN/BNR-like repeat-containing protein [Halobacteriales archaeon]